MSEAKNSNKILSILVLGTLMSALDGTVVLLALPSLTSDLNTNLVASIWIILSYILVTAVATTQLGRIGDIFGRSRMFNLGFVIFTVGSALCGLAPNINYLNLFRIIQAVGGSLLAATSGAIIADTFEANKRGHAFGYLAVGWSAGAMLGIVLGGVLTTFFGWRYIFYINIPIGIIAVFLGLKYIKDNPTISAKLDIVGMLLMGTGLVSLSLGAVDFASQGYAISNEALVAFGVALLAVFLFWEKKARSPILQLQAFKNRVLTASILASLFQSLGYFSVTFILIMYLQGIRGLNPLDASLLLIPGYIVSSFVGPYMGKLSDKIGARTIATVGILLMCIAVTVYLTLTTTTSLYVIVAATVISGFGISMFFPANNSAVMSNTEEGHYGSISGLLRTTANIGTIGSYVLLLTAATAGISRNVAFQVFVGTSNLIGGVSSSFLAGLKTALYLCLFFLVIAGILSALRGKENRDGIARKQRR